MEIDERKVSINGLETNFKIAGFGPAILILHGWGASSDAWIEVIRGLAGAGFCVICPDFPGFGKSSTPMEPWSVADYASWLLDFAEEESLDEFHLIAHSFGGRVGIKLAAGYPEKIDRLIFCAPAGIKMKLGWKSSAVYWTAKIGNQIIELFFLKRFKNDIRNFFCSFFPDKDYAKADGVMKETLKKVIEEDLTQELGKIKSETLLIWGKKDKMIPVKYADIFEEKIRNLDLEILSDAGHSPNLTHPGKIISLVLNFFKQ